MSTELLRSPRALQAATALALLVAALNRRSVIGALVVLWFMMIVPGAAVARFADLPEDGVAGWVVVIALSFAMAALSSEAMVYLHVWTPQRAVFALASLSGAAFLAADRVRKPIPDTPTGEGST